MSISSTYSFRRKCLILLGIVGLFCSSTFAQGKATNIILERSETLSFDKKRNANCQVLKGDVVFRHDATYMYCDSAYFYDQSNNFDAFGNITIEQGDTLFIYGDVLYYDGNAKLAKLEGNVHMINRETNLETDVFDYDRARNIGYYYAGGKIYDQSNTLTSVYGEYSANTKIAKFKTDVHLWNDKFNMESTDLIYNTNTKIADLAGPSTILYEKETTIYSEKGWYNTITEESELLENSYVKHIDGKKLIGDTILYNKKVGEGLARSNVQLLDTAQKMTGYGHYCFFRESDNFGLLRDSAFIAEYSNKDTLFLHADTLKTFAIDSLHNKVKGIHNVRFFRVDLQGKCDSIVYSTQDSILNMYESPVLWSDSLQLTGDFIQIFQRNNSPEMIWVQGAALGIMQHDSLRYNQVKGKSLKGHLKDNQLHKIEVEGNAESIYYPTEEDGSLVGLNRTESSTLILHIKDKEVDRIVMTPNSSGVLYPEDQVPEDQDRLLNFVWLEDIRPKDKQDIFTRYKKPQEATKAKKKRRK